MSEKSTISNDSKQKTKELSITDEIHMTKVNSISTTNYETSADNISNQQNQSIITETDFNQINLPDYDRIKTVGQGSFGVAVLYRRKNDQSLVVLKQINLGNLTNSEKELAMNEADVFSKLHHPNIICYLGSFIRGNILLIEMEYADGGTLAQVLGQKKPHEYMPERNVVKIFEQITSAIAYMHSQNILHRDLKTANVFLNMRGTVKLGDFGISKIMSTNIHAQTVLGTPYYFSPEMCEGKDYDTKSDIWALGCILGEICCLEKAFAATNLSELVAKIMSAQYLPLPSGYSDGLKTIMKLLLQVNPIDRPTAVEVLSYWIPLVSRSISKNRGYAYTIDNNEKYKNPPHSPTDTTGTTSSTESTGEIIVNRQYIETSTATVHDPRIERSVLYQMKSLSGNSLISPLQLPATIKIVDVATNGSHFLAVTSEGLVYSWGEGNCGQLGHGTTEIWKHYPSKIESIKKYKIIGACAGDGFSIFWTDLGVVLSCGDNSKGCLGLSDSKNYNEPKLIENLNGIRIVHVACGPTHVVALCSKNFLYTWGTSHYGALGLGGNSLLSYYPQRIYSTHLNREIKSVVCSKECSVVVLSNGDVFACGKNNDNRLGFSKKIVKSLVYRKVTDITRRVTDVSVTIGHSAFLMEGGYVVTLGKNDHGQRGLGHCKLTENATIVTGIKDRFITKIRCASTYTVVYSDDNIITIWGTRSGISNDNGLGIPQDRRAVETSKRKESNFELGNSTAAFTNFLASVYKPELILEPTDLLALYASSEQLSKGYYIKLSNIYPLNHSILILVDTTTPLATTSEK